MQIKWMKAVTQSRTEAAEGSISVFLAFLFLLLTALTGVLLDSGRYFGASGYMSISAHAAGRSVFGEYNQELFREYHLFGYGGYDGRGEEQWRQEFLKILARNVFSEPTHTSRGYSGMYGVQRVSAELDSVTALSEQKEFLRQAEAWLKTQAVQDVAEQLKIKIYPDKTENRQQILDSLDQTERMEKGEFSGSQEEVEEEKPGLQDRAGGNPLDFIKEFVKDGFLHMVCSEEQLSEERIHPAQEDDGAAERVTERDAEGLSGYFMRKKSGLTAGGILQKILREGGTGGNMDSVNVSTDKGILLLYATQCFGNYVSEREASMRYEWEYIVGGQERDVDNLSCIVDRLLVIRTLMNYSYAHRNTDLLKKSMATAEAIVTVAQMPVLQKAVQEAILLILSLEESCVDIRALLQGRMVPFSKEKTGFKMEYEEICLAGRSLFQKKAEQYDRETAGVSSSVNRQGKGMKYEQYLLILMAAVPKETVFKRIRNLIQDDLQKRYNGTFELSRCICSAQGRVDYEMPFFFSAFWKWGNQERTDSVIQTGQISALTGNIEFRSAYH